MGLSVSLIGANTAHDHGLRESLDAILHAIRKQGVDVSAFRLGTLTVPTHYSDNITEGLGSYSSFSAFRNHVRSLPHALTQYPHLLGHSDCDGFFLPISFPSPLWRVPGAGVLGRLFGHSLSVGSSTHLLDELNELNSLYGLPQLTGSFEDDELETIADSHPDRPADIWCTLHWFARQSTARRVAIAFC